jgi:hypothetical protein
MAAIALETERGAVHGPRPSGDMRAVFVSHDRLWTGRL